MSSQDIAEFHSFLEGVIETTSKENFSAERIVHAILNEHPDRLAKIQAHVTALGLRTLIRNNCRAKRSILQEGPDLFGHFKVGKRIAVPFYDNKNKLRFTRKRRDELSFHDLDRILMRLRNRPQKPSRELENYDAIAKRVERYRDQGVSVFEALELARRDGVPD